MSLKQQQCVLRAKIIGPRNHASENMNGVVSNFREVFVVFEYVWDLIFPREFDLLRKRIWVFHFWDLICSFLSALFFWELIFLRVDLSITETFIFCELIFQRVDLSQNWSFHFLLVYFSIISEGWSFHDCNFHFLRVDLSISEFHIFWDLVFLRFGNTFPFLILTFSATWSL